MIALAVLVWLAALVACYVLVIRDPINRYAGRHTRTTQADVTAIDPEAVTKPDRGLMFRGKGTR